MSNPFDQLDSGPTNDIPDYELIGGALGCQNTGCFEVVGEGKYFSSEKFLTWKCSQGHISRIVDFEI